MLLISTPDRNWNLYKSIIVRQRIQSQNFFHVFSKYLNVITYLPFKKINNNFSIINVFILKYFCLGESSIIDSKVLNALDSDSDIKLLRYVLTSDPSSGELFLMKNGKAEKISHLKNAQVNYFTQKDIDNGKLFYHHSIGNPVGLHHFKFNVIDSANNALMDQKFFISIFGKCILIFMINSYQL